MVDILEVLVRIFKRSLPLSHSSQTWDRKVVDEPTVVHRKLLWFLAIYRKVFWHAVNYNSLKINFQTCVKCLSLEINRIID